MHRAPAIEIRNLSKSFPGVKALDAVSLRVEEGEVHALAGENGAGKSTLMKILAGNHTPDVGEIYLRGKRVQFRHPHDALQSGIAMVHQELQPFPDLTVAENIAIGREKTRGRWGWLDTAAMRQEAQEWLDLLGARMDPGCRMRNLTVAEMQTVEIAKALAHKASVMIMDEPTSAATQREVEALFRIIRDLTRRGVTILYVSHRIDEVLQIASTVSVLRDGRLVGSYRARDLDRSRLIAAMVGRELEVRPVAPPAPKGPPVLEVRALGKPGRFRDISFSLRPGEILGLAGLMGAGRTDVAAAIFGLSPADTGEIRVRGRPVRIRSSREAISHGIAMVTEDRRKFGIVPEMPVTQNITLANLRRYCHGPFVDRAREDAAAREQVRKFSIRAPGLDCPAKHLSGGNQQKILMARALLADPSILILDEPTRGIDVGAKAEIYAIIAQLAQQGMAILMVSSEMEEILSLSHRILVMCEGSITAELDARRTSQEEILKYAMPV